MRWARRDEAVAASIMESFVHLRKGKTPKRLDACTPSHTRRLFEAIGHPDKEMYEIPGANHYYAGPDQRDKLRQAGGIVTDWLVRHEFATPEDT